MSEEDIVMEYNDLIKDDYYLYNSYSSEEFSSEEFEENLYDQIWYDHWYNDDYEAGWANWEDEETLARP